jgi:hypothetical protein
MAFIDYVPEDEVPEADRVPDHDNILRIHGVAGRCGSTSISIGN